MADPNMTVNPQGNLTPNRATSWWIAVAIGIIALIAIFGLGFGTKRNRNSVIDNNPPAAGRRPINDTMRPTPANPTTPNPSSDTTREVNPPTNTVPPANEPAPAPSNPNDVPSTNP